LQEQAIQMKDAYKNMSPVEYSCKKCGRKQQQEKDKNELHEVIMKEVQQSMTEMFDSHQHHHLDNDPDID
jgi:NifB/MoaA-like Fe-S oxidoreductase